MRDTITFANRLYSLKDTFDVNLTLDYENDSWSEWHIIREFISNALDSVNMDTSKVKIERLDNFFSIADMGNGFPIVMAKRIGASSKKNDSESIGQFGEGSKMAILTCMRKNINVLLGSQNWLIKPYVSEAEGQQVLHYNIYYCQESILGSFVLLEASEAILDIIDNLDNYFLCYSQQELLFGVNKSGILRRTSEEYKGNIYNKEVFIKTVPALFSYGISLEKMNRDRDLIDLEDLKTVIRNILKTCKCKEVIKEIIKAAAMPYDQHKEFIELVCNLYTYYGKIWCECFKEIYSDKAILATSDFPSREAAALGYIPITLENNIASLLHDNGIMYDRDLLSEDFEIEWANQLDLTREEKELIEKTKQYASVLGWEINHQIKVFHTYHNHDNVVGLFDRKQEHIAIKKCQLEKGLKSALNTYIHELTHQISGADDYDRAFAATLNEKLTELIMEYVEEHGFIKNLKLLDCLLELPDDLKISAKDLNVLVIAYGDQLVIKTANNQLTIKLDSEIEPKVYKRKIRFGKDTFSVLIPDDIAQYIVTDKGPWVQCRIK